MQLLTERVRDSVFIEGLLLNTVIGINSDEQHLTQPLLVDVELGIDHLDAGTTDNVADTIDYGVVRQRLIELATSHRVKLLEAFAELIAETTMREFSASRVKVRVSKPRKFEDMVACGVTIERCRLRLPEKRTLGLV